jgi:hypothetical protein
MAQEEPEFYLTGQVVAAYRQVRLTPQDFACLREAASAKAGGARAGAGFRKAQLASACLPKPRRRQGPF